MDPCDQLQKLGQGAYRRKNYPAALDFFNSVIFQEKIPAIDVLDNRAATYEKLGDLHAALKDGRRMITDHKTSCAGYLRTGKILQLLGKPTTALGIYQYGLRNVSPDDPNFKVRVCLLILYHHMLTLSKLLRRMHEDMIRSYGTGRAKDPLTVLPAEIAEMILSYLDFRQIVSLLRVSARWQEYLCSMPSLWKNLDFSAAKASIPRSAIQKYLGFSRGNTTQVVTSRFMSQEGRIFPHIFRVCRKLETLRINSGSPNESLIKAASIARNLKTLVLGTECHTTVDCVNQVLRRCLTLTRAEFYSVNSSTRERNSWSSPMPKLHTLTMKLVGCSAALVDPLLEQLPEIGELTLANCSSRTSIPTPGRIEMDQLHLLRLYNFYGSVSPQSLPCVRVLELEGAYAMTSQSSTGDPEPHSRASSLVELSAPNASFRIDELLQLLGRNNGDLRRLSLPHAIWLEEADLDILVRSGILDSVIELDLSGDQVTDAFIELLAPKARQLRSIKIGSTSITGISVKALVARPDCQLHHLDIRHCLNISIDAIDLARAKVGLKVLSSDVTPRKNGRKIRYE
ncbi:MAG: hypothetical protein Q9177_001708 [Variospora cf. flavescens]